MLIAASQAGNWVSKHFTGKQKAWSEATQTRVDLVKILLEHLQKIKMMGYSSVMELKYLLATFLNALRPAIILGIYTVYAKLTNHPPLDTDRAFTSFALIQMVT
ncbi:hypothetical protein N7495_000822 [Penicillium taxi]|uniref:uncharacterized protein n=1 Tax=Penicillium taxi TaxID=168475 RepID=UPI002545493B|nr:uncharacterized protein N7495_000822 [Penicillium taxi]KAJ5908140.1 hypothetical protein N7495_000822 [Penicillium taxi]